MSHNLRDEGALGVGKLNGGEDLIQKSVMVKYKATDSTTGKGQRHGSTFIIHFRVPSPKIEDSDVSYVCLDRL